MDPFTQDEGIGKYFIYHIDKGLSIFPTETTNRPDLAVVGEYLRDQGDAFICSKGTPNQAFPCRKTAARAISQGKKKIGVPELKLTSRMKFATFPTPLTLVDADLLLEPSTVASTPTVHPSTLRWLAAADAHHPRSPIYPCRAVCQ